MKKKNNVETTTKHKADYSDYLQSPYNTSCSGGTVSDVTLISPEENSSIPSYRLTYDEFSTFPDFETVDREDAEDIIDSLFQLSILAFQASKYA